MCENVLYHTFAGPGCKFATRFCTAALHTPLPLWVNKQHPLKRLFVRFFLVQTLVDAWRQPRSRVRHARQGWFPRDGKLRMNARRRRQPQSRRKGGLPVLAVAAGATVQCRTADGATVMAWCAGRRCRSPGDRRKSGRAVAAARATGRRDRERKTHPAARFRPISRSCAAAVL
jgi:hypothetical protein